MEHLLRESGVGLWRWNENCCCPNTEIFKHSGKGSEQLDKKGFHRIEE
jgi:hypothetical protein